MKQLLSLLFLFPLTANAQDWALFPYGQRSFYYTTDSLEIYEIRQDSIQIISDTSHLFFNKKAPSVELQECYNELLEIDDYDKGINYVEELKQKGDTIFYFNNNYSSLPFYIILNAPIGASWDINNDYPLSSWDHITMTYDYIGTEFIISTIDSVKYFSLHVDGGAPGEYSIQLGLMNKNTSEINFTVKPITFEISPPLWKRAWFITIIICSFLLMSFLLYRWKILQLKKKNAEKLAQITLEKNLKESKLQLIKSQMNPHFFFNAINNIQSYIFTNDTQVASAYLSKFSKLTRKILEVSDTDTVTLQDEIDTLKLYLELQKMRFEDFNFKISYDENIRLNDVKIPTMLFQPYVENAILHGLAHSNGEKNLAIEFRVDKTHQLITTIQDNGIGRVKSAQLNKLNTSKPKSFATKANLDRIMLLNKDQYNITIDYIDLYDENEESNGTLVTIKMKI